MSDIETSTRRDPREQAFGESEDPQEAIPGSLPQGFDDEAWQDLQRGRGKRLPTVLLIDDDPLQLSLFKTIISHADCKVLTAQSVDEALEILDSWIVDLIVCDIVMPQKNGMDLLCRVRQQRNQRSEIPVIMLTAQRGRLERTSLIFGADAFCHKNDAPQRLVPLVEFFLEK